MAIQKATTRDLDAICSIYRVLFSDMAVLQPYYWTAAGQDRDFLTGVFENEKTDILIAKEAERILGFALVQERQSPPYTCLVPHRFVLLMDLAVLPEERGRGIGTALLDAVKEWSRARDVDYIELQALSNNTGAIRLYEREGFAPAMQTMRIRI